MKKLICILAGAALLGACEQKTEVAVPAATPDPAAKAAEMSKTGARPRKQKTDPVTLSTVAPAEQSDSSVVATPNP